MRMSWTRLPLHVTVIGLVILWTVPTLGLFVSSFRPGNLVTTTGWWTAFAPPYEFTLDNYERVLTRNGLFDSFLNSLTITIPSVVIPLTIAAFAAYAFAWMDFPGKDWILLFIIGLLVVPLQLTFVPVLVFNLRRFRAQEAIR